MSRYLMTEDQENRIDKAKKALSAVALLTDEARRGQPDPGEMAALLNIIAESIPEGFSFCPRGEVPGSGEAA